MSQNMSETFYALILKFCLKVVCKGYKVLDQVLVLVLVLVLVSVPFMEPYLEPVLVLVQVQH